MDDLANTTGGMKMSTTLAPEQIEKVVVESLQTFGADPEQITPEATFEALDIDSLDLAELSQIVYERFGVELKGSDVADVKTVEDAINLIVSRS
jgi:acyl carrier protein